MFQVLILNAKPYQKGKIIFQGNAAGVVLPGEDGTFEILDFHKPVISRLKKGVIQLDQDKDIPIEGGVVKMSYQKLVALVET